jgi:chemotaxis-related protein WspD
VTITATNGDSILTDTHSAATRLLDREVSVESLRESTAHVAATKNVVELGTKSVVIFRIGTEWLALSTDVFQEISDRHTVRRVPGHRVGILSGLVNVRGELLLCVALDVVLGLDNPVEGPAEKSAAAKRLMICKRGDARLAFQANEVLGLHHYLPREMRNAPATLTRAAGGIYTIGVVPWQGRIVGCLDDELLFYTLNKGLL